MAHPFSAGKRLKVTDKEELFNNAIEYVSDPGILFDAWQEHSVPDVFIITDWTEYDDGLAQDIKFRHPNGHETNSGLYKEEIDALIEAGILEEDGYEDT